MLDAAVVLPAGARAAISGFLEELRGPHHREALRGYVANSLFIPTDDQERKERVLEGMSSAPQHVMVSAFLLARNARRNARETVVLQSGIVTKGSRNSGEATHRPPECCRRAVGVTSAG